MQCSEKGLFRNFEIGQKMKPLCLQFIKLLIDANFYISVGVLITGCLFSVSPAHSFFEFNEELYGALINNLRIMMLYLAATEVVILAFCFFTKKYQFTILIGFFLILMIGSLEFYGEVNNVETDPNLPMFFLYVGISHILFGAKTIIDGSLSTHQHRNT